MNDKTLRERLRDVLSHWNENESLLLNEGVEAVISVFEDWKREEDAAAWYKQLKKQKEVERVLRALPKDQWYSVIWDSDGDFLITSPEDKRYLSDLFCKLKELKSRRARDEER